MERQSPEIWGLKEMQSVTERFLIVEKVKLKKTEHQRPVKTSVRQSICLCSTFQIDGVTFSTHPLPYPKPVFL